MNFYSSEYLAFLSLSVIFFRPLFYALFFSSFLEHFPAFSFFLGPIFFLGSAGFLLTGPLSFSQDLLKSIFSKIFSEDFLTIDHIAIAHATINALLPKSIGNGSFSTPLRLTASLLMDCPFFREPL